MFEKEAEEYAKRSCFTEYPNPSLSEDIDISDEIKEAVLYGYNKATEWHYPSKGELPDKDWSKHPNISKECFVLTKRGIGTIARWDNDYRMWFENQPPLPVRGVVAWQYFVPPKKEYTY